MTSLPNLGHCACFAVLLLLLSLDGFSQTVDCSNPANCSNEYCNYPANVEQGCRCFDGLDNDGDGKIDKADLKCAQFYGLTFVGSGEGDCSLVAPSGNPFEGMAPPAVSGQNTADTQSKVSVGDLDGDGLPETVITSKWNQEIRVVSTAPHTVGGVSYAAGDIKANYKTTGQGAKIFSGSGGCNPKNLLFEHENLIANIDKTGPAELFAIVSNRSGNPSSPPTCFFLLALRYQAGGLVPLYDAIAIGPNRPGVFGIADMDGDGKAELYLRDRIYAAETGALLATGNGNWDLDITSGPVAVDVVKGDGGKMELVCGTKIYSIPNLSNRNPGSPAALTLVRDMNDVDSGIQGFVKLATDPVEYGEDTHSMCSVADIDNDGNVDVVISGALGSTTGPTAIFYWNVAKNKVSYFLPPDPVYPNGWPWGTGRVNLIDSDNDHILDMFFVAGNQLFRVETTGDSFHPDINSDPGTYSSYVNVRTINDSRSGVLTVTLYDFNNDGQFELVYRDSQELAVVDAATLSTKLWSATCQSHTYTEGPVIADVNGDGATDICVACNRNNKFDIMDPIQQQALGEVRLFYSSTNSWLPTRKVWNQPGYFVININDDLTLPFPQYDQTTVFSDETCTSNGLSGPQRPLNTFLNQLPYISANGCPVYPSPDLTYYGDDPAQPGVDTNGDGELQPSIIVTPPICGNTDVAVQFNVINSGLLPISASVPVSFYNGNPTLGPGSSTLLHTATLNLSLGVGVKLLTAPITFNGPGSEFDLYVVLNNTGFPVAASGQSATDCDLQNNILPVRVIPTPFTIEAVKVLDNTVCAPTDMNGEVKVDRILKGTTVVTDWSQYNFQWYDGPAAGPNTIRPGDTNYNLQGLAAGTYSVIASHKTIGCSSAPVDVSVTDNILAIPYSLNKLSDQTQCSPLNGALELDFEGADLTGVSIIWRDANSNEIVAEDVTSLSGLKGDVLYQVTVSRGTCSSSKFQPLTAPIYPRGIALHVRDVMSCLNPESGKVTARALITDENGIDIHDLDTTATKYRFTWYNYENGARQSLIPNQPTEGPTAWNLPVGSYEVVITDLTTNCTSVDPIPPVTVGEGFTLPTAEVQRVKPQTSCDPNFGNAALQGIALENGAPATDPEQYHYYWYEGQNTLTKLRDNNNVEIDNSLLEDVQGGVRGGGLAYTVEVVHKITGCSATAYNTAEEIINIPVVSLDSLNNDICPNDANLPFSGQVTSSVTFAGAPVGDFTNYTFNWYNGSVADEAQRVPDATALQSLTELPGGHITLVVEESILKCRSLPVVIQVQDILAYPVLTPGVTGSTNCTTPPSPDGVAQVATVDGVAVPASGILAPYTFQWYSGDTATPGNEAPGTNNLGLLTGLQGSNDPTLANYTVAVMNDKGCASFLTIHVPDNRVLPVLSLVPTSNANCAEGNGVQFTGNVAATITNQVGALTDYTFNWTNATLGNRSGDGLDNWPNIEAGTYSLSVIHKPTGCASPVSSATVTNTVILPVIEAIGNGSTNCAPFKPGNGSATVETVDGNPVAGVTANYSFEWFAGASATGTPIASQYFTPSTLQGAADAFFTVAVTNLATNCVSTSTVQVPDLSALPVITLSQDPNVNCENFNGAAHVATVTYKGSAYANTANLSYAWFDGSGTGTSHNPQINSADLTGLEGGQFYSATVTMIEEGCTSDFVAIEVADGIVYPDITTSITGSKNCPGGTPDGSASVTTIVPTSTYEIRWYSGSIVGAAGSELNDNVNDVDIIGLQGSASAYFTVEAKNMTTLCASTETVLVPDESSLPVVSPLTPTNNPNCPAFPDGTPNAPAGRVDFNGFTYEGNPVASPYNGFTFIWTGPGAPAEGANLPAIAEVGAGSYSLQIRHVARNCVSDIVTTSVVDAQAFPDITTLITPQTSCDDVNFPTGSLTATVAGGPAGFQMDWFEGVGTTGSLITETSAGVIEQLRSGDFTVRVFNTVTACTTTETVFLPNEITYPAVALNGVGPVTNCSTPNGTATAVLSEMSSPESFTLFYVRTVSGETYPTDPAVIKASTETYASTSGIVPPALTDLAPGYITALVRDLNTHCDSQPVTAEIRDETVNATITVTGKALAGFCTPAGSDPTGAISVDVAGGTPAYTFAWYNTTPTNTDIDFIGNRNPPDFGGATPISTDKDLVNQPSGIYTLVVIDDAGCGTYLIDNVPFQGAPTVTINTTDVTRCVDPFDGVVEVQIVGTGDYGVTVSRGNSFAMPILKGEICDNGIDDDGDGLVDAADPDCSTMSLTLDALAAGDYFIQVTDYTANNKFCPLGFGRTLIQRAFGPLLSLDQINPNTSCDPDDSGDGSISLIAMKQSNDVTTPSYQISSITPVPSGFVAPMPIAANVPTAPITGFGPETYTITVNDVNTGCESNTMVTIPDQPQVPQDLQTSVTPDSYCVPASNGAVTITSVAPGNVADYEYTWYDNADLSTPLHGPDPDNFFNATKPGWKSGAMTGRGHGNQSYFVRGIKTTGPGAGCPTPVVMAVVNDTHVLPQPQITTRPNTSCLPAIGEGSVSLLATTTSPDAAVQNATYTYVFNTSDIRNAQIGTIAVIYTDLTHNGGVAYPVVVTNEVSQCVNETVATVQASQFGFNITQNTVVHQMICDNDGGIAVTEIVLNRSVTGETNISYDAALTNDFDFRWFKAPAGSPGTFDNSAPLQDGTAANIISEALVTGTNPGEFPGMEAGTYYVIATRKPFAPGAGCETPPYRVDVLDQHVNPTVALTAFTNTSCDPDPANAEGSIVVRITADAVAIPGPFTYAYDWTSGNVTMPFPNVNDGDGSSSDNDNDNITSLPDGVYSLTVRNLQTGCEVTSSTTITKNETPVFITDAISLPQELCINSGSIEVTLVEVMHADPGIGRQPAPLGDFTYTWSRDGVPVLQSANVLLDVNTYPDIEAGTYYVTATRTADPSSDGGPGFGCSSAPLRVDIIDQINYPNVTIQPFANTACADDENFFEGSALITINETGFGSGATYEYTWTADDPANTSLVLTQNPKPSGLGTGDLQTGLRDDNYHIEVFNPVTGCTVNAETSIIKTTIPVIIAEAGTTPKLVCLPDGSAFVESIRVDGDVDPNFNNFNFTWSEGTLGNNIIASQQGVATLNNVTYPNIGVNSLVYFVSAVRRTDAVNADMSPARGRGCTSAPVMVVIQDQHIDPTVAFALSQNTSCNDLMPNGSVIATAADPDGLPYNYTFNWTYGGTLPASTVPFSTGVQNGFTSAPEGLYTLHLVNDDTGCDITQAINVELNERASYPNIIEVLPTSPVDCNNSGSALVTRIFIGNDQNTEIPGTDPRFTYTWYTSYTNASVNTPIGGQSEEEILNVGPGRYFVTVLDTFEDRNCPSGPNEVVIDDPVEIYPVPAIAQLLPQISCRPDDGTAQLIASADGGNTGAPYVFSWYSGLGAEDGNELLDDTNTQFTGSVLDNVANGIYSVRVHNTMTNCLAETYFIIEDARQLFYPRLLLSTAPRTNCVLPDGVLEVREVGYNLLNTTDPSRADYYRFAPDFSADYVLGPKDQVGTGFDDDMTPASGFDQLTYRTWSANGLDAGDIYTVKVTDENTGCFVVEQIEIPNHRENPAVDIVVENPLISCYSAQPNGQLLAIADGGKPASGYDFFWHTGEEATGTPVGTNDRLIGVGTENSNTDLMFTVRVVNRLTMCEAVMTAQIPDSRTPGETPTAYTVQDDSRCDIDDGWVTAHVNNVTYTHNFFWFNGNITGTKTEADLLAASMADANYRDLGANDYTVYAQNRETGCISLPVVTTVKDITVIPRLIFETTASYCEDVPSELGGGKGNGTIALTLDPADVTSDAILWTEEKTGLDAGTGNYVTGLFPGFYQVEVTTNKGCIQTGRTEVPTDIRNYNLVTQNSDGKNDRWIIDCISRFPLNNVKIFNRSGVLVFEADGYDNAETVFEGIGKRGLYMTGNVLPVGTYFYIIDKRDGSKPRTGYLELVR